MIFFRNIGPRRLLRAVKRRLQFERGHSAAALTAAGAVVDDHVVTVEAARVVDRVTRRAMQARARVSSPNFHRRSGEVAGIAGRARLTARIEDFRVDRYTAAAVAERLRRILVARLINRVSQDSSLIRSLYQTSHQH